MEGVPGLGDSSSILLKIYFALELGRIRISTGILRLDLLKIDCLIFFLLLNRLDSLLDLGGSLHFLAVSCVVSVDLELGLALLSL